LTILTSFLREQRHIFGTCPQCHALFRLVDARVSYDSPYKFDWLDEIQTVQESWQTKTEDLEEKGKEMRRVAIERATRTQLPKLLKRMVPTFAAHKLNPKDIKTVFHPIDFVVFDGLNKDRVNRVLLMDRKTSETNRASIQKSITDTIRTDSIGWETLRVNENGVITREKTK
jgi:predicted Holliday junction resolvase-like endonuclease